jgi:quinolinate synthase
MQQIQPEYLLWVLEELAQGRVQNEVIVAEEDLGWARVALDRMLTL